MKLSEISGSEVLDFSDYMERVAIKNPLQVEALSKIGADLFKAGFHYDDTVFVKLPEEGGVYEIAFPQIGYYDIDRIVCVYYAYIDGVRQTFSNTLSIKEVELWTVPALLDYMKTAARPRRT